VNVLINDLSISALHVICLSIEIKENLMGQPCSNVVYMTEVKNSYRILLESCKKNNFMGR